MSEFVGFIVYGGAVYTALLIYDELQQRRRVAAWRDRARRLQHMRGGTP